MGWADNYTCEDPRHGKNRQMSRLKESGSFIASEEMQDTQLLEELVNNRSPQTFAAIVERYSGMVYASALRQVGETHLAEEVAQSVFVELWRNANSLKPGTVLVGWLLTATRYRAANALRLRRRREHHEKEAAQLRKDSIAEAGEIWLDEVAPHLDAALASLSRANREAVLLRFFEGESMRAISVRLCISEDAAKQRVSRSMDQLRMFFDSRGVVVPVAVLPQILASQANLAPVAGMVQSTIAGLQTSFAKGVVITMAASNVKVAVAVCVLVALVGGSTAIGWRAFNHDSPPTMIIQPNPTPDDWRASFNKVYGLAAGQQVKYVAPPFIPERDLFWEAEQRGQGNMRALGLGSNESLVVESDGASMRWRSVTLVGDLGSVLQDAGIKPSELDASVPGSMPLEGDWVVRKGAPAEQVVEGIAAVVSQKVGRNVRIERRQVIRDVIVVRGNYHFTPLPGKSDDGVIDLVGDRPLRPLPMQIRQTTLGELLSGMSGVSGLAVVDETGQSRVRVTVADHPSYGKPETVLRNVAAQTSLQLDREPRSRQLWFMTDAISNK